MDSYVGCKAIQNRSSHSLVTTALPALSFENCAFDEMDIDGGTGNITVTSSQSLDGYMMDLDSGTGDITLNGNDFDDEYEVNEHAKKHLVIDSGLGDIVVKY